jgi:glucose/arabinose dehydrogenase
MKFFAALPLCVLSLLPGLGVAAWGAEPDDLILPPGFHASVVAENLGEYTRHMAFRDASHMYVSTEPQTKTAANQGIMALHLDANHHVDTMAHFSTIHNGTAIAVHQGALYTASPNTLYRFKFAGNALVPTAQPDVIVDGIPGRAALAFDAKGGLYLAMGGSDNTCVPKGTPKDAQAKGLMPCPDMTTRAGVWRFDAARTNQKFAEGEHYATGIRDTNALAWSKNGNGFYSVMYGRDGTEKTWPAIVSAADGAHVSDEMFKVVKGTDMGWPYTYYDSAKNIRLAQPEYGGDGKTPVTDAKYAVPVAAFPAHVAPMDIAFYEASQFPAAYRGGAFIAFHGAGGGDPNGHEDGYNVMFVPLDKSGKAGKPQIFADGFAGPTRQDKNGKRARYRPVGVTVGPDGALYIAESQKGRIWRIAYTGK